MAVSWMVKQIRSGVYASCRCAIVAALALMFVGCAAKDHRISVAQLMELEASERLTMQPKDAPSPQTDAAINQQLGPYHVGPNDVLTITLTRADQPPLFPSTAFRVDRKGEIDLPVVGSVKVVGLELDDLEDTIRATYVPGVLTDAVVHAEILTPETTNVLVVGAVSAPGFVALERHECNLLYAIVGAGGVSDNASGEASLQRIRQPELVQSFNLRDPLDLQQAIALKPLEQGDIVQVNAAEPNTVFVGGLVLGSSPQTYPTGTNVSVLQALASAGGLRTDIQPQTGTLVRRLPSGREVHVRLDLDRIAMGQDKNLDLQAGDILWVPYTWQTRLQEFVNKNFFMRAGVSVNYSVSGREFLNRPGSGGGGGGGLQDSFDPFGFLGRNSALQGLTP